MVGAGEFETPRIHHPCTPNACRKRRLTRGGRLDGGIGPEPVIRAVCGPPDGRDPGLVRIFSLWSECTGWDTCRGCLCTCECMGWDTLWMPVYLVDLSALVSSIYIPIPYQNTCDRAHILCLSYAGRGGACVHCVASSGEVMEPPCTRKPKQCRRVLWLEVI